MTDEGRVWLEKETKGRKRQSESKEKMWDIWKSTSRTSQHVDKHLRALEGVQGKVFVTRKMVRTLGWGGRRGLNIHVKVQRDRYSVLPDK